MSARDEEFVELLSKTDKDPPFSPFDHPSSSKKYGMEREGEPRSKWLLIMSIGFFLMTIVVVGLVVSIVNGAWEEPLVEPTAKPPTADPVVLPHPYGPSTPIEENMSAPPWMHSRLPTSLFPLSYNITLNPDLTLGRFSGSCNVLVKARVATSYILLHANGLNFTSYKVFIGPGSVKVANYLRVTDNFLASDFEYLVLKLDKDLEAGQTYQVVLEFYGTMADEKLVGLYRSTYHTKDGTQRYLALTKFEPTDARRVFPCFDEPEFKAKFQLNVIHESRYTALANMPAIKSTMMQDGLMLTEFEESVLMSTYLVAIVIADFEYKSGTTNAGTEVRVYARPDQVNSTSYAVHVAVTALNFYADYYKVPYPLPKQDLVAIPDFMSGAMENWGLISFRETYLLFDPDESSFSNQKTAMTTIVHELGHMWFGNLVTMKWWDDLWLNEGFARFTEQLAGNQVEPTWGLHEDFVTDVMQYVMVDDAGAHTHPVVQPVNNPREVNSIFDSITYDKGASSIYMLEAVLGTENFRKGLQDYLSAFSFNNTVTLDLWNKLSEASNPKLDVAKFMDTFTKQEGLPVVFIQRNAQTPNQVTATQQRFFSMPNDSLALDLSTSPFNYTWELPFTYLDPANGTMNIQWLHQSKQTVFRVPNTTQPLKFNVNNTGYYRVNYEEEVWLNFAKQLYSNHTVFTETDRANLLDDVFSLCRGGYLNYSVAFEVVKYLTKERNDVPLEAAVPHLSSIASRLKSTSIYSTVRNFTVSLLTPIYNKIGWASQDDYKTRNTQNLILSTMCQLGYLPCIQEAVNQFQEWKAGRRNISQDLRSVVYKYGIQSSYNSEDWDYVWNKYSSHQESAQEMDKLMAALTATREPWLIYRLLSYAKDPTKIRSQDFFTVIDRLALNPVAVDVVWEYVRSEWDSIVQRFTLNANELGRPFTYVSSSFNTPLRAQEMEEFITRYPDIGAGQLQRQQALDKIKRNIEWLNRCKDPIEKALSGFLY